MSTAQQEPTVAGQRNIEVLCKANGHGPFHILIALLSTYQVVEDVPLMDVNGNERLVLGTLDLGQVLQCHVNQAVQHLQERLVGGGHDLFVRASVGQSVLGIASPDHLDAQDTNLIDKKAKKIERVGALGEMQKCGDSGGFD